MRAYFELIMARLRIPGRRSLDGNATGIERELKPVAASLEPEQAPPTKNHRIRWEDKWGSIGYDKFVFNCE